MYCLDKRTGKIVWERTACTGVPKIKRHPKASHANPTPATDGVHVIASFGSEGLYCYDRDGKLLWQKSLGVLDSGWFYDADYQWGFGSSPILYQDTLIVQCDVGKDSFLAAYRVADGQEVWRTPRDEIPSWGTPTIVESAESRRARHQRHEVRPRLRSANGRGVVAAGPALRDHRADADLRRRSDLHHQRLPPHPADLRHPPRRDRRHLAQGRRDSQRLPSPGASRRAGRTCPRRSSTTTISTLAQTPAS